MRGNTALAHAYDIEVEPEPELVDNIIPHRPAPHLARTHRGDLPLADRRSRAAPTSSSAAARPSTGLPYCAYHSRVAYQPAKSAATGGRSAGSLAALTWACPCQGSPACIGAAQWCSRARAGTQCRIVRQAAFVGALAGRSARPGRGPSATPPFRTGRRARSPAPRTVRIGSVIVAAVERLAQAADMDVDGALVDIDVAAPHAVEQAARARTRGRAAPSGIRAGEIRSGRDRWGGRRARPASSRGRLRGRRSKARRRAAPAARGAAGRARARSSSGTENGLTM